MPDLVSVIIALIGGICTGAAVVFQFMLKIYNQQREEIQLHKEKNSLLLERNLLLVQLATRLTTAVEYNHTIHHKDDLRKMAEEVKLILQKLVQVD